jgi:hypothetical protein
MDPSDWAILLRELQGSGCWFRASGSASVPSDVLQALGPLALSRNGASHRDLLIHSGDSAPPQSMSAKTGADEQPMHTDAAYDPCPPRFIVLWCMDPGEAPCPTNVLILDADRLKQERPGTLTRTNWVAHGGGRPPFYCPVMDVRRGGVRIRFDPLCMRPIRACADAVDEVREVLDYYSHRVSFDWERGSMLIIDNWRCLHARGRGGHEAPSRRLRRWNIGVDHGLVV